MESEALQKLLDLLFGEEDGTEVEAVIIVDLEPPVPVREKYRAYLYGLEGELVQEFDVRAEDCQPGPPPQFLKIAYTKPPGAIKWDPKPNASVCFDTIVFKLTDQRGGACCYERITPAFGEET